MDVVEFIARSEAVCFSNGWTADDIRAELESGCGVCCTEEGIGYAIGRISFDEAELHRIAVLPEKRRSGAGERLLRHFLDECGKKGAVKVFLEVRSKNLSAVRLYERCGFMRIAVRKNYYGDDDAVVYAFTFPDDVKNDQFRV